MKDCSYANQTTTTTTNDHAVSVVNYSRPHSLRDVTHIGTLLGMVGARMRDNGKEDVWQRSENRRGGRGQINEGDTIMIPILKKLGAL